MRAHASEAERIKSGRGSIAAEGAIKYIQHLVAELVHHIDCSLAFGHTYSHVLMRGQEDIIAVILLAFRPPAEGASHEQPLSKFTIPGKFQSGRSLPSGGETLFPRPSVLEEPGPGRSRRNTIAG